MALFGYHNCFFFILLRRQKPYRLRLLLTRKSGDFGAVSETNLSCAVTILKVDWDRLLCLVFMYDVNNFEKLPAIVRP